jgi:hypothetical protein
MSKKSLNIPENNLIEKYRQHKTVTITRKEYLLRLREYVKQLTQFIMTVRFTEETWEENAKYRKKLKTMKCIYCSPVEVAVKIPPGALLYVIEMNNDRNIIMGIGLIKNTILPKSHPVHNDPNYNRYSYGGTLYIAREEFKESEKPLIELIEMFCFKGSTHMKRSHGISAFSFPLLFKASATINIHEELRKMFKTRLEESQQQQQQ